MIQRGSIVKKKLAKIIRKYNFALLPGNFFKALGCVIMIPLSLFCLINIVPIIKMIGKGFVDFGLTLKNIFNPLPKKEFGNFDELKLGDFSDFSIKKKQYCFCSNALVIYSDSRFNIIPMNNIIWAYGENITTKTKRNIGFSSTTVAVGHDLSVIVRTKSGKRVRYYQYFDSMSYTFHKMIAKDIGGMDLLADLAERYPYLILGYSKELDDLYKNNRQQFIKMAFDRKVDYGVALIKSVAERADSKDENVIIQQASLFDDEVIDEEVVEEPVSVPDEIKKYKELLDTGAITQEEYDKIKKRLLKL